MKAGQPSETALAVAAMRAAHLEGPEPHVFSDPWALRLTSDWYRELASRGELLGFFSGQLLPILGQIVGRARWAEDALEEALGAGVAQYVILGAGLDAFALRRSDLLAQLQVFELDHPDTQRYKLARLTELEADVDPRVHFVAVDLEQEEVGQALARTSFSSRTPSFFSWLGVVSYLTADDVMRTLAAIRACAAPGSQVAMDYPIAPEHLGPEDRALFESIREGSAGLGEPRRATHDPDALRREICALGYECVEDLSCEEHRRRYFAGRGDGLGPYPQVRLARFRVAR
jgi:methyltransferase (TIGR00027 family)